MTEQSNKQRYCGAYSKYQPEYCELRIDMARAGNSYHTFCSEVGISEKTYRNWRGKYEKFREADEIARTAYAAFRLREIDGNIKTEHYNHYSSFRLLNVEANQTYVHIDDFNQLETVAEKADKLIEMVGCGELSLKQADALATILERTQKMKGLEELMHNALERITSLENKLDGD